MATILDGKALAAKCKEAVKAAAQSLARKPGLAVIIVGNNPASRVYVNSKRKDCEECGFLSEEYALPEETTQAELIALIEELNGRADIDGILCQLPLPQGIDEEAVLLTISPEKDVDGFHPMSMGSLLIGREGFLPCTPYGINTHRMLIRGHRIETPEDALYTQVSPDALQIDPLLIAPLVAAPLLVVLLAWMLGSGRKHSKPNRKQAKKGGNPGDDDQNTDR